LFFTVNQMATGLSRVIERLRVPAFPQDGGGFTDGQLLEGFLTQRREAAFAALVRRHGPMVLGVCRRVLHSAHDAEDAFQATFLVLVRKADGLVSRENIGNWLYGVAYHTALKARAMAWRRRVKERQVVAMPKPAAQTDDGGQELLAVLDRELKRLPDKYREAVVLCDLEGKTRKGAARQLRIPESTLSSRLDRARALLAARMRRHGLPLAGGALAMLLAQNAASASLPALLVSSTARAASLFAAGKTAGVISAHAMTLTQGVLKAMLLNRFTIATATFLALTLGALGTSLLTCDTPAAGPGSPKRAASAKPGINPNAEAPSVSTWQESAILFSQVGGANSLAFSPDGKTLAVAGWGGQPEGSGKVELWDVATKKIRATIDGQPGNQAAYAASVAFSRDGKKLAVAGGTSSKEVGGQGGPAWLRLFDPETKKGQEIDPGHAALIKSVAFSPDSKLLATGSWDFTVKLFDVATGKLRASITQGPRGGVGGVAFSPDGSLLASANTDGTVKLWDVATAKEKASLGQPQDFFPIYSCLAFSPDGKTIAAGTWNKEPEGEHAVHLFDVATGNERSRLQGHKAWIQTVAFTPDGKTLATGGGTDRTVKLWDTASGRELAVFTTATPAFPDGHGIFSVTFARDGKTMAAGGNGQTIKLWKLQRQPKSP
jgi:RNA polymerase sigma factor (sigma-70 family)